MSELNDELLSAWLDGQLDEPTRLAVEQALASDAGARVRLERMRHTDALLRAAIAELPTQAGDPLAARIAADDTPRAWRWPRSRTVAACLVAGVGGLLIGRMNRSVPDYWVDGSGTVHGELQQVLEQQASSGRAPSVRVILTTQLRDGRYCRQFAVQRQQGSGEGLACRSGERGEWHLLAWDASTQLAAGFQPAGGSETLDAVLDRLGASEAFDASKERALIEQRWSGVIK